MAFVAIYDACVLHPPSLRDLLIRLAAKRLLQAKWTTLIIDECVRSVAGQRPDLVPDQLARLRGWLTDPLPDCLVTNYEALIDSIDGMPDPDDRHVVAAAIRAGAQMIVTFNLKDFPADALGRYDIEAQHPDEFVVNQIHLNPGAVLGTLHQQAASLTLSPRSVDDVLLSLEKVGLVQTVTEINRIKPW